MGQSAGHAGEQICGGGSHDDKVGGARELDMADHRLFGQAEEVVPDRLASEGRSRQGRNEFAGCRSHRDADSTAQVSKPSISSSDL